MLTTQHFQYKLKITSKELVNLWPHFSPSHSLWLASVIIKVYLICLKCSSLNQRKKELTFKGNLNAKYIEGIICISMKDWNYLNNESVFRLWENRMKCLANSFSLLLLVIKWKVQFCFGISLSLSVLNYSSFIFLLHERHK